MRKRGSAVLLAVSALLGCTGGAFEVGEGTLYVEPGQSIQAALDQAAAEREIDRVLVRAGTYAPPEPRQALIWFNSRHDGLVLEAEGQVVLTAANPQLADPGAESYPAIVNHVVYFGDGIGPTTILRGFEITGANDFVTEGGPEIQPSIDAPYLEKSSFFYTDGGGIKIFGRSYPTIEGVTIRDNYSSPCGAGISIEHRGYTEQAATIRDSVFINNRVPLTGSAIDLLDHERGSAAVIENCLFVGNLANEPMDERSRRLGTWKPKAGHGALTVFPFSHAEVRRCTFVGNRNGVDDVSTTSIYEDNIFWENTVPGGWPESARYEADIRNGPGVRRCVLGGGQADPRGNLDPESNVIDAPDPGFEDDYTPTHETYRDVGYRPNAGR